MAYELLTNPRKQGSAHTQSPEPPQPPTIVPVVIRGSRKKNGARRGYMPPGHQPGIKPGDSFMLKPGVKLGSVPFKDLPPWMPRATFFKDKDGRDS